MRLQGSFESHPRYGRQFRVESCEILKPAGLTALERYLSSGQIKGVGPALAHRITEHFGEELFAVLDHQPHRLREVRGIGAAIVRQITAVWQDQSGLRELMVFLRGHGMPAHYARRIHKLYGVRSLGSDPQRPLPAGAHRPRNRLSAPPTRSPSSSVSRAIQSSARAAPFFTCWSGWPRTATCAPRSATWKTSFAPRLDMDPDLAQQAVAELAEGREIILEGSGPDAVAYLRRLHEAETNVAKRLRELSRGRAMADHAIEQAIAGADKVNPFPLSVEQKIRPQMRAQKQGGGHHGWAWHGQDHPAALDADGAGSAWVSGPRLAAPTGRAARRLADATGREAKTIHRILEYSPGHGPVYPRSALSARAPGS